MPDKASTEGCGHSCRVSVIARRRLSVKLLPKPEGSSLKGEYIGGYIYIYIYIDYIGFRVWGYTWTPIRETKP